jgi:GT2 family glycosyltransferase
VRGCQVRYVHSRTRGVARARNLGIRLASKPSIVILDDDMLVHDDWLERLLAGMSDGDAQTVATGRVLAAQPERPGLVQPPYALITRSQPMVFRGRQPFLAVPGANVAVPRSLMIEIGGYDERLGAGTRFPGGEDHDASVRLLDAGCEVRHVPEAIVMHRAWRSQRDVIHLRWRYARGVGAFYAKHAGLRDRHALERAGIELRTRVSRAVASIISSPKTTAAHLLSIAGLLVGAVEWSLRYRVRLHRRRGGGDSRLGPEM